jgi:ubiquinone/menaquinone biosynthesis C-methylase UbiE
MKNEIRSSKSTLGNDTRFFGTHSSFRRKRGKLLARKIQAISGRLGRSLHVLDVGGRAEYWDNVGMHNIAHVKILNNDENELNEIQETSLADDRFSYVLGDARNLSDFEDGSVDFVHSNSVIEHVGAWWDMEAMAREMCRVGAAGWMQTPAWEFPVEPHFRVLFMHWFAQPVRRKMLWFSKRYRHLSIIERRFHCDRINLLSSSEVKALFPSGSLIVERFISLPKSYVVTWGV